MKKLNRPILALVFIIVLVLSIGPAFCQGQQTRINLDLKDTPVRAAIDALFKGTGLNFAIAATVTSSTIPNLSLKDVSFDQALRTLTKQAGLTYRVENGVYMIDVKKEAPPVQPFPPGGGGPEVSQGPEPADRKVEKVTLNFADATDIAAMFGGMSIQSRTSALAFGGGSSGGMGGGGMMGGGGGMMGGGGGGMMGGGGGWR